MKKKSNTSLSLSIIFSALVISGSLVFFGFQMHSKSSETITDKKKAPTNSEEELELKIREGIEAYVYEQQYGAPIEDMSELADDDAFLGDEDAPVTIVEFSDYQCPFCQKFFSNTLPELKEKYIDTGKVKLIYRDFPLSSHRDAVKAAVAAECVREQKADEGYFQMHDLIFQGSLSSLSDDILLSYATQLDINEEDYIECTLNPDVEDEVNADLEAGSNFGVSGTPAFFIDGLKLEGAQPFSEFERLIEERLAEI